MTNPHIEQAVVKLGCEINVARRVVVLVHGRGQTPLFMEENVTRPLALKDVAYVAPTAANECWYPLGFMAALAENEPWLTYTMTCIDVLVNGLAEKGCPRDELILAGFSQGACVIAEYICRYPQRYGGVAILTGGLIGPEGTTWKGDSLEGTPVFLGTSDADEWVPLNRVKESHRVLVEREAKVDFRVYKGMGHIINNDEIDCLRNMILS
ncbi:MAG: phospholipase/carboxylesterase [Planctomycetota bacterium]|jgi:phospholipase/carboxylesterase